MMNTLFALCLCLLAITCLGQPAPFKVGLVADLFDEYSLQDVEILQGTEFWATWVNSKGGLYYDGAYHQVEVVSLDASVSNPNLTASNVQAQYELLATHYNVSLMLAPTTTSRVNPSLKVSEKYKIINFVTSALTESLFTSNNSFIFTTVPSSNLVVSSALQNVVNQGAKTYVLQQRTDSFSIANHPKVINFLNQSGLTMVKKYWANATSTDINVVKNAVQVAMTNELAGVEADLFISSGLIGEWPTIATVFQNNLPKVKAAVWVNSLATDAQAEGSIGQIGNYWIASTRFDPNGNFGVSGELGGTTAEFSKAFTAQFNAGPLVNSAISAALLMSYYKAVQICGTINSTIVRQTMKTMGRIETFACPIEYQANGTNKWYQMYPMQLINGNGVVIKDKVVYPAPFNPSPSHIDTTTIIAIVVPIGVVVLVLVGAGIFYMQRKQNQVVKALVQVEEGERRNYKISYSELSVDTAIGAGGFGVVYRGEYRGAEVAVKKLKAKLSKEQLDEFAREASLMVGLRHPNILLFMGACLEPNHLCIVTEYMSRGSLFSLLGNKKIAMPFPLVKRMLSDVLRGLQYIHSAGIIHRDLKSPNLLVDRSWNLKIADFGLSAIKSQGDDDAQLSLLWTAPEILNKEPNCYSEKSDIYSFAIIMYEVLSRKVPFEDTYAAAIAPAVIKGQRPTIAEKWDDTLVDLMSQCWHGKASQRPTVKDARAKLDAIYVDPDFEAGGSSTLERYIEKIPPPTGTFAVVSTTVCNSAKLWEHDPHVMKQSLIMHNECMRSLMSTNQGYEVAFNGDSFLIAFSNILDAVNFCLRTQVALLKLQWPETLLRHPDASEKTGEYTLNPIYRGLCVSMGIHQVTASSDRDQSTGQVQYRSPDLDVATMMARQAAPGTIVMGPEMYARVVANASRTDPFSMSSLGLRSIKQGENTNLYQAAPKQMEERNSDDSIELARNSLDIDSGIPRTTSTQNFEFPRGAERWIIRYDDLQIGEKIGAGSFGEVKAGNYRGQKVAIKELIRQKVEDNALLEIRAESAILSSLQHENIIRFIGMCTKAPHTCLVAEFMEKGDLSRLLYNTGNSISWAQRKKMALDMAKGMAYLHQKGIVHRDIKSSNMLVAADFTVKIADFGFSRMKSENQTMTQQGTVAWTAPEIFEGGVFTEKSDVYSFGIVLWEVIARKKPWEGMHTMKVVNLVCAGKRLPLTNLPVDAPVDIVQLMQNCWAPDPAIRPTFADIIRELM